MAKIFVTGGISSGKSNFAEETALSLYKSYITAGGGKCCGLLHFIATAKTGINEKYKKNGIVEIEYEKRDENEYEDEEMALKIKKHKERRNKVFIVHENFDDLKVEIDGICKFLSSEPDLGCGIILIDSMTLWLSSIFKDISYYDSALESVIKFSEYLSKIECSVVAVADSLGFNTVPVDAYVRKFIELNGLMEQELSALSDKAYCVIAGNPVPLK